MKGVADTSWLYAVFDERDAHHRDARDRLAEAETVTVPAVILAETLDLIAYRVGKTKALEALKDLEAAPMMRFERDHDIDSVREIWRKHKPLTYADASAVASARRVDADLLTFDKRQNRALASA